MKGSWGVKTRCGGVVVGEESAEVTLEPRVTRGELLGGRDRN